MKKVIYLIAREFWWCLSWGSLILAVLELIKPRLVLAWLNLNLWLAVWLASGIIMLATKPGPKPAKQL
jgi:hypothetical protein